MKALKAIVFIFCFLLFWAILASYLRRTHGSAWSQIADIVLGLIFWLALWQLSSGSYENHRGVGRWVQPSGLFKAFLILVISYGLGSWALWSYFQVIRRPYFEMARISNAIDFFTLEYKVYPGKPGPIMSDVYDELKGSANAKINIQHIDYITEAKVETVKDSWGHPYYFRIDSPDPRIPRFPNSTLSHYPV